MGELRSNKAVVSVLDRATDEPDLDKALQLIVSVLSQPLHEEKFVVEYDSTTGKPSKEEWKLQDKPWDGKLYPEKGLSWPGIYGTILLKNLEKRIGKGEGTFLLGNGELVLVTYEPRHAAMDGITAAYFSFKKLEVEEVS